MKTIVSVLIYVIICRIHVFTMSVQKINLNAKAAL